MFITPENKEVLIKRASSLMWRLGGMVLAYLIAFILKGLNLLEVADVYKVVIGLVISEITKYYGVNLPVLRGRKSA